MLTDGRAAGCKCKQQRDGTDGAAADDIQTVSCIDADADADVVIVACYIWVVRMKTTASGGYGLAAMCLA